MNLVKGHLLGAIVLLILSVAGCSTIGDGQCFGGDCVTSAGQNIAAKTAAVSLYLDEHPQARAAIRLARAAACIARPDTPVICTSAAVVRKVNEARALVAEAMATGGAIDQSDQQIADALGGLTDDWLRLANEQVDVPEPDNGA